MWLTKRLHPNSMRHKAVAVATTSRDGAACRQRRRTTFPTRHMRSAARTAEWLPYALAQSGWFGIGGVRVPYNQDVSIGVRSRPEILFAIAR